MSLASNDVYVVDAGEHGEILVPAIRDVVRDIDVEAGYHDDRAHAWIVTCRAGVGMHANRHADAVPRHVWRPLWAKRGRANHQAGHPGRGRT